MNKRILFVGSDADEREDVERSLGPMTRIWDMVFARHAAQALELMGQSQYDAVVTDMRLPDLSGAELLNKVADMQPRALRFIRASFADQSLIMACVWGTHHFIPKPCEGQEVVTTLNRGLALNSWLSNDALKGLLSQMGLVPCLPSLYFEVMKQLESPSASVESIAAVVGKDLAMTAKLLQMVNSAFFGLQQKVTSVHDAITILGMETVKSIVLSIHAFSHYEKSRLGQFSIDQLWSHSVSVAREAKRITHAQTHDQLMADESFSAGLLHDIGKLALAANFPEKYTDALEYARSKKVALLEAEQKLLGATHCEAGAYLLGLWGMPISLIEAALFHHRPAQCSYNAFTPLTAVHVADVLDHEQHLETDGVLPPTLDTAYFETLGLVHSVDAWRGDVFEAKQPEKQTPASDDPKNPKSQRPSAPPPDRLQPSKTDVSRLSFRDEAKEPAARRSKVLVPAMAMAAVAAAGFAAWMTIGKRPTQSLEAEARSNVSKAIQAPSDAGTHQPIASGHSDAFAEPMVPEDTFPAIHLEAVNNDWIDASALINGNVFYPGDHVDGAQLVEVTPGGVTLRFNGETRTFNLP
jgi:HD-like signal output (HDOD) protein/ActR/RegA family two-component response regulator